MLVVAPEYGVDASGGYRPGGLAQFARLTTRALSTSERIETLVLWGLLDDPLALDRTLRAYIDEARRPGMQVRYRGFSGRRARMSLHFAAEHLAFDHVMFMHLGPGRLATLRMFRPYSFWLVGIEVRKCLDRIERRAVTRAQPLLSISTFSSDEMRAFNPGLPGAQTVHLGMEPDAAWSMTDHRGGAYHAADRAPAIMIVGRLAANERYKGHDQLIDAWPEILTRRGSAGQDPG